MAIGAGVGGIVGGGADLVSQLWANRGTGKKVNWKSVGISALAGAAGGALGGGFGAALTGVATGATAGTLSATSLTIGQTIGIGAISSSIYGIGSRSVYYAFDPCSTTSEKLAGVYNPKMELTWFLSCEQIEAEWGLSE